MNNDGASAVTDVRPCAELIDIDATFLPVGQMRQISRVVEVDGQGITGEVDLGVEHWVFAQHFPGDPIFPGALIIEAAGQLVALWAWSTGQRGRPRLVRIGAEFHNPVGQDDPQLMLRAQVRRKRHLNFGTIEVIAGVIRIATLECVLAILPIV
ncbi:MAG TPA: hypothetical protein VGI92_12185 [Gemmatimonadales bacterium]